MMPEQLIEMRLGQLKHALIVHTEFNDVQRACVKGKIMMLNWVLYDKGYEPKCDSK